MKKISCGIYEYKGYRITNYGYYPPDHCTWWEAVHLEYGCADFHATTKREIKDLIDQYENTPYPGSKEIKISHDI